MGGVTSAQETFAAVMQAVLGDAVDPDIAWDEVSKMDDASEVHVQRTLQVARKGAKRARKVALEVGPVTPRGRAIQRTVGEITKGGFVSNSGKPPSRKEVRTGQALNVVATVGALNALRHQAPVSIKAIRSWKSGSYESKMESGHAPPKPKKAPSATRVKIQDAAKATKAAAQKVPGLKSIVDHPGRSAAVVGGGLLALHTGELMGDGIAARALHRQSKVAKSAYDLVAPIIEARKSGLITTDQAVAMAEEIAKFSPTGGGILPRAYRAGRGVARQATRKPFLGGPKQSEYQAAMKKARRRGLTALGVLGGTAAAAGAAGYAASRPPKQTQADPPVAKSDGPSLEWRGEISKVDEDKRQVFGWASLTSVDGEPVVDRQGDYIPLEEIEKAAYHYVLTSRKGGDMHAREGEQPKHTADLIESFLVTPEKLKHMGLDENAVPHGWWIGMKVNDDEQWELVKKQERTGFSIHGKGSRVEKDI